jgi:hypothetical protein
MMKRLRYWIGDSEASNLQLGKKVFSNLKLPKFRAAGDR